MNSNIMVFLAIMVMAIVTASLRFAPFIIFKNNGKTPVVVEYLGKVLPGAIMAMLVVYCLKGISFVTLKDWLPALIACVLTAASYVWKRNTLISITFGTALYMILIRIM